MIYTKDIIGYQWDIFLKAAALGVLLGGCYDVLRVTRTIVHFGKRFFILSDFIYCVCSAFLIFSFLLNENFGIPRFYIFFGNAIGFFAWYFTLGKLNIAFAKKLRRFLKAFFGPIIKIFRNILKSAENRTAKAKIIYKKAAVKRKSLLKKKMEMVYNILCLNVQKAFLLCGKKVGKELEKLESDGTEKTEEGALAQSDSRCLRSIHSILTDINSGEHK